MDVKLIVNIGFAIFLFGIGCVFLLIPHKIQAILIALDSRGRGTFLLGDFIRSSAYRVVGRIIGALIIVMSVLHLLKSLRVISLDV